MTSSLPLTQDDPSARRPRARRLRNVEEYDPIPVECLSEPSPAELALANEEAEAWLARDLSDEPTLRLVTQNRPEAKATGAVLSASEETPKMIGRPPEPHSDPWMTSRESAAYAGRLSDNGAISSEWRKVLRRLEEMRLAHRQGPHRSSPLRTRRSTVDKVIRGDIDLEGGKSV